MAQISVKDNIQKPKLGLVSKLVASFDPLRPKRGNDRGSSKELKCILHLGY